MILSGAVITVLYFAQVLFSADPTVAYLFLISPKCDDQMRDTYDKNMHFATDMDGYLRHYEVLCFGGIQNFWIVDNFTAPIMRILYPDKLFVFVFDHNTMASDFARYLYFTKGSTISNKNILQELGQGKEVVMGYADIPRGIGFADDSHPYWAKHELAHLMVCGTWHGVDDKPLGKLVRYPGYESFPWCNPPYYNFPN